MKNYSKMFKIEASNNGKNSYVIRRRNFSNHFITVATVEIIPNGSFEITSKEYIKSDELSYLHEECRKLTNINNKIK